MQSGRTIGKRDIRKWMRRGLAFLGVGIMNAATAIMALIERNAAAHIKPMIIGLIGGVALLLFIIATLAGVRYMRMYRRYKRYFQATGLTRCSDENVERWLTTGDVTK